MKISEARIDSISKKIAFRLVKERLVRTVKNLRQVSAWVEYAIYEDFKIEESINKETTEMLSKMTTCPPVGSFEYNALFQKKREEVSDRKNFNF